MQKTVVVVAEDKLDEAKATFARLSSIAVYSLQPAKLSVRFTYAPPPNTKSNPGRLRTSTSLPAPPKSFWQSTETKIKAPCVTYMATSQTHLQRYSLPPQSILPHPFSPIQEMQRQNRPSTCRQASTKNRNPRPYQRRTQKTALHIRHVRSERPQSQILYSREGPSGSCLRRSQKDPERLLWPVRECKTQEGRRIHSSCPTHR